MKMFTIKLTGRFAVLGMLLAAYSGIAADVNGCIRVLSQTDFVAGTTVQLATPGSVCLSEDIVFTPAEEGIAAIEIVSNDVTLDLRGFRIRQGDATSLGVVGVRIGDLSEQVFKNVTIKNGSILNFTESAISCLNLTHLPPATPASFDSLNFKDLELVENGTDGSFVSAGIELNSFADQLNIGNPANIAFRNVSISNCHVDRCKGDAAIRIITGENVVITDTTGNNLSDTLGLNTFAFVITAQNLKVLNVQGNNTRATNPSVVTENCGGADLSFSSGVLVKDSQFNDTYGEASDIVNGVICNSIRDAIFERVEFNNPMGGSIVQEINCVHMSDFDDQATDANGIKFIKCQFNGARSIDGSGVINPGIVAGTIIITAKNLLFEDCQCCRISVPEGVNFNVNGFVVATVFADPVTAEFGTTRNVTFRGVTVSDLSGPFDVVGFECGARDQSRGGSQAKQTNYVIEDSIVSRIYGSSVTRRIAGIAGGITTSNDPFFEQITELFPIAENFVVRNTVISDVRSGVTLANAAPVLPKLQTPATSPFSAGILFVSQINPVLRGNIINACDRGILLTGTDRILPNGFQLAPSPEAAQALQFIDIGDIPLTLRTSQSDLGPYPVILANYSPPITSIVEGPGRVAIPVLACTELENDLSDAIGIARRGVCAFALKTANVEEAGAIGTVIVSTGAALAMNGLPTGSGPSVSISFADGNELITAIESSEVPITLTIDTEPTSAVAQRFINLDKGNQVEIFPTAVNQANIFVVTPADLTALGWETGDRIQYIAPAGNLPGIESGTIYYAIVYRPGYTENGLLKDNDVSNCLVSGFQDNRVPTTSAFVSNTAFNNNGTCKTNYNVNWSGKAPVCHGPLSNYKKCQPPFNVSLVKDRSNGNTKPVKR